MSKYMVLKELINEWLETELGNLSEIKDKNSCGAGMSMGAIEAYRQVLADIQELEQEITPP